jgi:hypothetical protein
MGFVIKLVPDSTFYLWLDLEGLPGPISDGLNFFQACLEEKVIVVPGIFFDLNPSKRRDLFDSPCHHCELPASPSGEREDEYWTILLILLQSSDSHMAQEWKF